MRRLWAVARTTLREAVRTRTALVLLVALVAVVLLSPFLLRGEGTLPGRVQLVLSYSLTAVGFLLSVLTIFLATSTLAGELTAKRIETIASKPIPRWQILAGKWLGVMLLDVALLAVSGAVTYVLVRTIVGPPAAATAKERQQLLDEVYVARHTVDPMPPDYDAIIDEEIRRAREADRLPEGFDETQYRTGRRKQLRIAFSSLGPGEARGWEMMRVRPAGPSERLFIRYKVIATGPPDERPGDSTVRLEWVISPDRELASPKSLGLVTKDSMGDFHEFSVPASVVGPGDRVYVACRNADPRLVYASFPAEQGVQLLYTAGTFEGNFVRTLLLMLVRLAFLAALGLAAAACFSFPVASLLVVFVFVCALSVNHFVALSSPIGGTEESPVYQAPSFHRVVLKAVAAVVPNFGRYDGTSALATGKLVPWRLVLRGLGVLGVIYGGVVLAAGGFYFGQRELAEAGPTG